MTNRENYFKLARREGGFERIPTYFECCPSLREKFENYCKETGFEYEPDVIRVFLPLESAVPTEDFLKYYDHSFKEGTNIDYWGIAHEKGSEAAFHMTKMYHPMENFEEVEEVLNYPFPVFSEKRMEQNRITVEQTKAKGKIAQGDLSSPCWEQAWYLRGMENLMADMMMEEPIAEAVLDKVTEITVKAAEEFARIGVDQIYMGDDIGMQHTIMMSRELYRAWLFPRLKKVISAAKAIKPDILIIYHSCGFVEPMIPDLIEAGVDVLNPIQPESMDFAEIKEKYGDEISFHGTIGTQTTMPFGTPEEVRNEVFKNLKIAGEKGGLLVAPTHMLEPEVPVENLVAYIKACRDFKFE